MKVSQEMGKDQRSALARRLAIVMFGPVGMIGQFEGDVPKTLKQVGSIYAPVSAGMDQRTQKLIYQALPPNVVPLYGLANPVAEISIRNSDAWIHIDALNDEDKEHLVNAYIAFFDPPRIEAPKKDPILVTP